MLKHIFSLLLIATTLTATAQVDTTHLRISLVTCGTGDEIWETFGHTAVRIIDSTKTGPGRDLVYNYGTFNYDNGFELKFMRGKLLYYLSVYPFSDFMQEYITDKRSVEEQLLMLNGEQKVALATFLDWNAEPQNSYYKYDFYFDNCATRIRDIFPKILGKDFQFARALPDSNLTFRNITNQYFYKKHWERLGVDILLGSKVDKKMSNEEIMFLPDFLRDGITGASLNEQKIAGKTVLLLPGSAHEPAGINQPLIFTCLLALLIIAGIVFKPLWIVYKIASRLILLTTGLLGFIILTMWFATDHQTCRDNLNILWALPTNIILAFAKPKGRNRYAVVGIVLVLVSLFLHVLKIQELPVEIIPFLLGLLFTYSMVYKESKQQATKSKIQVPNSNA